MTVAGTGGVAVGALAWPALGVRPEGSRWPLALARGAAIFRGADPPGAETALGGATRDARFERAVAANKERVFRVALSVLGPDAVADAEDVTQEVFVRAHRALPRFRGESRLSTWLYRMAFNLAVDHRRRMGRAGPHVGEEALAGVPALRRGDDPHETAEAAERERRVAALMAGLSEEQRSAIHLHYWMGHTVTEIAELLGVAPGTVKSHLHRGRERLRGALGAREGERGPGRQER